MRISFWAMAVLALILPGLAAAQTITVFAAASLKSALDPVADGWAAATGNTAAISYGSSSALATQIGQGAPADVFLSAAENWMDVLDGAGALLPGSRIDLWGNSLSLVAHDTMVVPFAVDQATDLSGIIGQEKLAMALVDAVPVGQYGKQALVALGQWDRVAAQVVQTQDARATLALVGSGEAAFGVVYTTDAIAAEASGLAIEVSRFPDASHDPIIYPAALIAGPNKAAAADFLHYMSSPAASDIFAAQGFVILTR